MANYNKSPMPGGAFLIDSYELCSEIFIQEKYFSSERYQSLTPYDPILSDMLKNWSLFGPDQNAKNIRMSLIKKLQQIDLPLVNISDNGDLYNKTVLPYCHECMASYLGVEKGKIVKSWPHVENLARYLFSMPANEVILNSAVTSVGFFYDEFSDIGSKTDIDETILLLVGSFLLPTSVMASYQALKNIEHIENDPKVLKGIIIEALRLFSPSRVSTRIVKEDCCIKGVEFKRGEVLVLMLSMANRDPSIFKNPDSFELDREAKPLTFGLGGRKCIGENLTYKICLHFLQFAIEEGKIFETQLKVEEIPGIHFVTSAKVL